MEPSGLFKNLVIDAWYKAFVYVGGITFVAGLFIDAKAIKGAHLLLLSLGFFFIGIGEWKNHKTANWFNPFYVYRGPALMSVKVRLPDAVGIAFDILGVLLSGIGVVCIVVHAIRA